MLPSTTADHLFSLMRQRPITTQSTFHAFIKGTLLLSQAKKEPMEGVFDIDFSTFTLVKAEKKQKKTAFLRQRKKNVSGFQQDRDDGGIKAWQQFPASAITA